MTGRNQGRAIEDIIQTLNRYIVGWINYFAIADIKHHMTAMDEWLRRRLRQICWKQWKTPRRRFEQLRQLGIPEILSILTAGTSKGDWRLSASPPLHRALSNVYWRERGLKSFLQHYLLRQT